MITATRKSMDELRAILSPFRRILVAGCGSCVAECAAGGEREVALLASQLRMDAKLRGKDLEVGEATVDRQCVYELIDELTPFIGLYDAVLSTACGAGVQAVQEIFPEIPILPALDTAFLGESKGQGLWVENCRGCGHCRLHLFGGICPIARCAKGLFNGPCGGSKDGHCEVDEKVPCAWAQILETLERRGQLELLEEIHPPCDWSLFRGRGPRRIQREDQRI